MAKKGKVSRPKGELKKELSSQIALMKMSCIAYDNGLRVAAKHLSLNLRVLLHHHGNSNALLQQLGLRSIRFLDSAGPVNPRNLLTTFNRRELVLHVADTDGGAHVDEELDEAYLSLSRENSLGWVFTSGDVKIP